MRFRAIWGRHEKGEIFKPVLWIGPVENIKSEPRKYLNSMDKQQLLRDQNYKCNLCENVIKIYPFSTSDADHIIPISLGGKTSIENIQLLCISCHREKSARELTCIEKSVISDYKTKDVFIGKSIIFKFPFEKMTPKEVIESNMDEMCLLTYKKIERIFGKEEINYMELLDKFKYKEVT